jgi:hypothetical protein
VSQSTASCLFCDQSSTQQAVSGEAHATNTYFDGLGDNLGAKVVGKGEVQVRLDRQAFVEELDIERLSDLWKTFSNQTQDPSSYGGPHLRNHEDGSATVVLGWAASFAHHLQDVGKRIINVPMFAPCKHADQLLARETGKDSQDAPPSYDCTPMRMTRYALSGMLHAVSFEATMT